ncbi:uncharacterized protein [Arachis hypogaea]|uniref:uncharacterized protein n=1 Tax=Arachis hypogaea TaxID=3818 RepID=UPI000DEC4E11|nr:uncharacterized protein LOC112803944 [Arachis hypogaea]
MTSDLLFTHGGPEEDPSNEFEVGQQFENKEEVMLAVKRLDSKVIAQYIFTMVKVDPTISIKLLQGGMENHFDCKASYRKIYLPGTWVQLMTQPWSGLVNTVMFHWIFFGRFHRVLRLSNIDKPLIFIDGTHLYGKYGGTLLMAIAQDDNVNILPIAFAVVEGETKEA